MSYICFIITRYYIILYVRVCYMLHSYFFTFPPHQIHTQHNTNLYFKNIKTTLLCKLCMSTLSPHHHQLIFFFMLLILAHVHLLSHQIVHPFYVDKIDLKFFQVSFSMHLVGMYVITPMLCPNFQR